jgi:adenine-specific DNA-methyltransferase
MEHLTAEAQKSQGAHYTPLELAQFVAKQVVAAWGTGNGGGEAGLNGVTILDPAVGGGELLEAIYAALPERLRNVARLVGMDSDPIAVENAKQRLSQLPTSATITEGDFLESLAGHEPDLFAADDKSAQADLIIANPPYVRTQVLGAKKAQALANKFSLRGRVDLSYPFVLGIIEKLRAGGIAGIITSNRFLSTRAGASLRERLRCDADVIHVWDLGDTKLFEAAVLPCVLLIRKQSPRNVTQFTSVYSITPQEKRPDPSQLFLTLCSDCVGVVELGGPSSRYEIKRGKLEAPGDLGSVWKLRNSENGAWAALVKKRTWRTLGELTKVRVGVKTTSDSVYIRDDWSDECPNGVPETLRPLITHHLAERFKGQLPRKQILYTHEVKDGRKQAISLAEYPKAAEYLQRYREQLENRTYVTKAGRKWFEIWVPQEPSAWDLPKIIFKDIAVKPTFWLDNGGSVVNGDCYWFTLGDELADLYWLALGVFNSTFIERFYDTHFANKLYSGRRRFMTQYVAEFPLPDPESVASARICELSRELFNEPEREDELIGDLNQAVAESFGVTVEEI